LYHIKKQCYDYCAFAKALRVTFILFDKLKLSVPTPKSTLLTPKDPTKNAPPALPSAVNGKLMGFVTFFMVRLPLKIKFLRSAPGSIFVLTK